MDIPTPLMTLPAPGRSQKLGHVPKRWHIFKVQGKLPSRPQVVFSGTSHVMMSQSWLWRVYAYYFRI